MLSFLGYGHHLCKCCSSRTQADRCCRFQLLASRLWWSFPSRPEMGKSMRELEGEVLMVWDKWGAQHLSCSASRAQSHGLDKCQEDGEMGTSRVIRSRGGSVVSRWLSVRVDSDGSWTSLHTSFSWELNYLPCGAHPRFHLVTEFISNCRNSGLCSFLSNRLGCDFLLYYTLTWAWEDASRR